MEKTELAIQIKHSGVNCCQAVLCAFADEVGMGQDDLKRLGAAFGSGMGCMEGTCGALVGAQMLLGMKSYDGKPMGHIAAHVLRQFEDKCGATACKDIKGKETGQVLCSCDDCVRHATRIAETFMS